MVDDNCELIVEVGDNRCWPCKSNRGNPPLDTTDQPPSDIISAIETMIKIKAKTKIMTKQGCMSHSQMLGKFEYGGGPIFKVVIEC